MDEKICRWQMSRWSWKESELSVGQILSVKRINPWTGTDFSLRIYSVELPRISSPRRSFLVISLHHFVQLILLWFWIMGDFARFTTPSTRGRGNKKQRNDLWLRLAITISCATIPWWKFFFLFFFHGIRWRVFRERKKEK